jgi:uncharacterized protein YuzE
MNLRYDKEADALYLQLRDGEFEKTFRINPDVALDYDANGILLGIEILGASQYLSQTSELPVATLEGLTSRETAA